MPRPTARWSTWSAGLPISKARTLRFIGDAEARIREDYLRILRFFRFFAWYGSGRPDAEGLKACARLKDGLDQLSAERVWAELKKLLSAPDPVARAAVDAAGRRADQGAAGKREMGHRRHPRRWSRPKRDLGWAADPLLRLEAIVPPDAERMAALAERLKLSNAEARAAAATGR